MKVLAPIGVFVLLVSLSFPLSVGAFGRSPSSSEVNQTGTVKTAVKTQTTAKTSSASTTTTDPNEAAETPRTVPEPSSFMLLGVAFGIIAVVSLKRRFGQAIE